MSYDLTYPEDLADAVRDTLIGGEAWVGGRIGVMDLKHEGRIRAHMTGIGLLGPGGCLTRKGAAEARREQIKYFGSVR
jgi:hypothetical protein